MFDVPRSRSAFLQSWTLRVRCSTFPSLSLQSPTFRPSTFDLPTLDFFLMADVFTPEKRSEVMSRIRSRDTKPEMIVRSMPHQLGYRFTVNGPKNRELPGRPDIVLPKTRRA